MYLFQISFLSLRPLNGKCENFGRFLSSFKYFNMIQYIWTLSHCPAYVSSALLLNHPSFLSQTYLSNLFSKGQNWFSSHKFIYIFIQILLCLAVAGSINLCFR